MRARSTSRISSSRARATRSRSSSAAPYPYVCEHEKIADCVDRIADYAEDSIPVLTADGTLAGALTSSDLVELIDEAMGDDYAKLGGLSSEEDLKEPRASA